jgi:hypothetical protein
MSTHMIKCAIAASAIIDYAKRPNFQEALNKQLVFFLNGRKWRASK